LPQQMAKSCLPELLIYQSQYKRFIKFHK